MTLFTQMASARLDDHSEWTHHMDGWGWGPAVFGWLLMAVILILIVWLIWSTTRDKHSPMPGRNNALAILDELYARGEIERDEYLRRKSDIGTGEGSG